MKWITTASVWLYIYIYIVENWFQVKTTVVTQLCQNGSTIKLNNSWWMVAEINKETVWIIK